MAYTVKIGGVDKTSLVSARSLIIRLGADHRGSADFAIITTTSYLPRAGQAILIEDTGTVFAGLITSAPQVRIGASTSIRVNVSAQGLYAVPGRRCASDTYADIDAGDIVSDLITSYLAAEGITAGTITAGAHLDTYDTYGKTIGAVLDELASVSGYQWYIDTAKALHFVQDIVIADAAHDLDEVGAFTDYSDVQINEDLDQYRNRQIIRGGIQSDGTALSYVAEDAAEIAARAAIEGGSGVYENVYTDTNIIDGTNAAAVASNLLKKYGRVSLAISFTSLTTGWRPATKLKVNLPSLGISTDRYFLVERVTLQDIGGATLRVLVEGVTKNESDFSTQMRDRYVDYFAKLLAGQKQVRDYTNQVAAGKTKSYFQAAQPTGGTYTPGDTWFDTDDDNRIYKWDGSAWVAVRFGENAIADLSITNAKIADATIQAAKIGTVDAGSITAGTIAAARIAASSITFDKLASTVQSDLKVTTVADKGLVNVLSNSNFASTTGWTATSSGISAASNELTMLATAQYGQVKQSYASFAAVRGRLFYFAAHVKTTSASVRLYCYDGVGYTRIDAIADGAYHRLSGLHRVDNFASELSFIVQDDRASGFDHVLVKYGMMTDLSLAFGHGNEPTAAQMDAALVALPEYWFDGTYRPISQGSSYAGVTVDATNGFVSTATIGGNTIRTKSNATEGFSIFKGASKIFGVDTDGNLFSSRLSNAETPTAWSIVGEITQGGTTRRGIFGYNSSYSSSDPGFMFLVPSYGGMTGLVQNGETIAFSDAYTSPSVVSNHYLLSLGEANGCGSFMFGAYDGAGTYKAGMDLNYNSSSGYWEFTLDVGDVPLTINDAGFRYDSKPVWYQGNVDFDTGSGTSSSSAGGDTTVTFGKTFSSAPKVVANTTGANSYTCRIKSVSTTGFVLVVSGSSIGFNWIAVLT